MLRKSLPFLFILLAVLVLVWTLPQCSRKPRSPAAETTAPTAADAAQPRESPTVPPAQPESEPRPAEHPASEPTPSEAAASKAEPAPVPPVTEHSSETTGAEAQSPGSDGDDSTSTSSGEAQRTGNDDASTALSEAKPSVTPMDEPAPHPAAATAPATSVGNSEETTTSERAGGDEPTTETTAPERQAEQRDSTPTPPAEEKHEEKETPSSAATADDGKRDAASTIILDGVNFASDSDQMLDGSEVVLDNVIESLKTNPEVRLEIAGYTDDRGDALYNRILSRRRAEAVMIYLVKHGIDARRLTAAGYGSDDPIADNDTQQGRQKNRRVELHIR